MSWEHNRTTGGYSLRTQEYSLYVSRNVGHADVVFVEGDWVFQVSPASGRKWRKDAQDLELQDISKEDGAAAFRKYAMLFRTPGLPEEQRQSVDSLLSRLEVK